LLRFIHVLYSKSVTRDEKRKGSNMKKMNYEKSMKLLKNIIFLIKTIRCFYNS